MQLGWARLTPQEHHRRVSMGLCIYCAQSGHYISRCPRRLRELQPATSASALASETNTSSNSPPCICLPATIFCPSGSANLHVLIDSGSDENFIDGDFSSSKFPVVRIDSPQPAINGSPLETVTHQMVTLSFTISSNHQEHLRFLVIPSPSSTMVLGLPSSKLHKPHIVWVSSSIVSWSTFCHSHCLLSAFLLPS